MIIIEEVLKNGENDWIDLSLVAATISRHFYGEVNDTYNPLTDPGVVAATLHFLSYILENEFFEIGSLQEGQGFRNWEMSINDAVIRVQFEWEKLSKPVSLSEICWLNLTEKGVNIASKIPFESDEV